MAEWVLALLWSYLLFHPALVESRSYAVAISLGLVLLFLKPIQDRSFLVLGPWPVLLVFWACLSSVWSLCPGLSLRSAAYLCVACSVFLTVRSLPEDSHRRLLAFGMAAASLAALMGIVQWIWGFDSLHQRLGEFPTVDYELLRGAASQKRAFGPLATSGALGALLILFIPSGLEKTFRSSGLRRFLFLSAVLVMCLGLLATQSIGACVCLAVSLLASAWVSGDRRLRWVGVGIAAMVGALFLYRGWGHWAHASWGNRVLLWSRALQLWTGHWALGAGAGCFEEAYRTQLLPLTDGSRFAHDLPLQTLVELGVVGGLLGGAVVWELGRRWKNGLLGTSVGCGVTAVALFSLMDLPWVMPEILIATAWMSALVPMEPCRWEIKWPSLAPAWVDASALVCLLAAGFFPPFRPWNLALASVAILSAAAYRRAATSAIHPLICLTLGYFCVRSFMGGSMLGSARFMTAVSLGIVFILWTRAQEDPARWIRRFSRIGLAWMLVEWVHFFKDPHLNTPGFFVNPKHLASFLGVLFLIEMGSAQRDRWSRWSQGASLLTMAAFRATAGLAGWVAGLWILLRPKKRKGWGLWVGLGMALLVFAVFWRFVGNHQSTPWGRLNMWKGAITIWESAPWCGTGPGTFEGLFHRVKEPQVGKVTRYLMDARFAHNEWLEGLVSFGLIGLALGLGVFVLVWRKALRPPGRAVLVATSVNALFDFIWHTPVLLWQSAGAVASACGEALPKTVSWGNAFLVLGLSLGLWGSAALTPFLLEKASSLRQSGQFQQALQTYQEAESLSAWDGRVTLEKAVFMNQLYMATGDPLWKTRADEGFQRVLEMEPTDGGFVLAVARKDAARVGLERSPEAYRKACDSFAAAEKALPFSAEVRRNEGDFAESQGDFDGAFRSYRAALDLEPNDASTWVALGDLASRRNDPVEARFAYDQALKIHATWVDQEIAPDEREMAVLKPEVLKRIQGGARP